jgi:hypothetical protein
MSKVTVWRYHLPSVNGEGWAIAFLDSIGCFSVLSDYGDYGHRWPEAGWGPGGFREFFVQCGGSYVLGKIARREAYYAARTVRAVKDSILESRRHGNMTCERARDEWDLLRRHESLYSREDFAMWYQQTQIDEAYELAVYDFSPQANGFMTHVFPRLQRAIREELAPGNSNMGPLDHASPCPFPKACAVCSATEFEHHSPSPIMGALHATWAAQQECFRELDNSRTDK